jgi:hypothetical protein
MSADVVAPDAASAASRDNNAQAAEDAKKMLAELSGGAPVEADTAAASEEKANSNTQDTKSSIEKQSSEEPPKDHIEGGELGRTKGRRDRDDGRSSRSGRGRGGYQARSYRDNIKSDLTTQEESSDPVSIRKQVLNDRFEASMNIQANDFCARSNSTSPTQISPWTNFSFQKLVAARIALLNLRSSTPSNACATFNPSRPLSLP